MKKILITGSSGYIGSHLCKMLENEYELYGFDINPPTVPIKNFYHLNINQLFNLDREFDAVVHLAALVNVGQSEQIPIPYYITNVNGTMNILNKAISKNFIFASTGAAQECMSVYGVSKRAAEDIVRDFCTNHKPRDYTIFRFYNVIGSTVVPPTNPDGLMHNLMKAIETNEFTVHGNDYTETVDGTCVRDYIHVMEVCDAIKTAIENPANKTECLGHGVGYTVKEIAEKFQKVNNCKFNINYGPRRKGDIPYYVLKDVSSYMKNLYSIEDLLKVG
jgi:UDP-glucose 4-epimerase